MLFFFFSHPRASHCTGENKICQTEVSPLLIKPFDPTVFGIYVTTCFLIHPAEASVAVNLSGNTVPLYFLIFICSLKPSGLTKWKKTNKFFMCWHLNFRGGRHFKLFRVLIKGMNMFLQGEICY